MRRSAFRSSSTPSCSSARSASTPTSSRRRCTPSATSAASQLTLRPEATAGIVRAAISNGLLRGARLKLWCTGPMFRHERPQKGRYRQFYQIDAEALGFTGPDVDAELIALGARLWRELKLTARAAGAQFARHPRGARGLPRAPGGVFSRARGGTR